MIIYRYDRTVKLFSSETLKSSATFDLGSTVYHHATSNVATHLLVSRPFGVVMFLLKTLGSRLHDCIHMAHTSTELMRSQYCTVTVSHFGKYLLIYISTLYRWHVQLNYQLCDS